MDESPAVSDQTAAEMRAWAKKEGWEIFAERLDAPPTIPDPPDRIPAIARIRELEERLRIHEDTLTQLMERHNKFVAVVGEELGL